MHAPLGGVSGSPASIQKSRRGGGLPGFRLPPVVRRRIWLVLQCLGKDEVQERYHTHPSFLGKGIELTDVDVEYARLIHVSIHQLVIVLLPIGQLP
jgi:hypothetical protein